MQRECGFAASMWGAGGSRPIPCPTGFRTRPSRSRSRLGFNRGAPSRLVSAARTKHKSRPHAVRHPCGTRITFGKTMGFAVPRERSLRRVVHGLSVFSWENGTPASRASAHVLHIERTRPAFVQIRVRTLACMDGRASFAPPARPLCRAASGNPRRRFRRPCGGRGVYVELMRV